MGDSEDSQFLLKPWFHWTDEERAQVILKAYQMRVLNSNDIRETGYISDIRLHNLTTWIFPVVAYPILNRTLWRYHSQSLLTQGPYTRYVGLQVFSLGLSWAIWLNVNPFYKKVENTKVNLLQTIEKRIGLSVKGLNDILPRWTTSQEYHRRTIELFNQRNGVFAGLLYPYEESAEPLIDASSFPKGGKAGKITK